MSWTKREAVTNLVILGDATGNARKVGGLLIGTPTDKGYPDKVNYEIVKQDGEVIVLSGSASLARQINRDDIGKFVKCEFIKWGKSPNGKFKEIDVFVFEGEPTDVMKAWPRYEEFTTFTQAQKKAAAKPAEKPPADEDFEDFGSDPIEPDDDLPF